MIRIPVTPFLFCEPFSIKASDFQGLWQYMKKKRDVFFDMDLKKAANLQQLKQVMTINEKHGSFIPGVEPKPNVVCFASQNMDGQILVKIEVSSNGKDCRLEIGTEFDTNLIDSLVDAAVELVGKK